MKKTTKSWEVVQTFVPQAQIVREVTAEHPVAGSFPLPDRFIIVNGKQVI